MSKVKVLVAERDGSELFSAEEGNPSADLAALKGIAFENLDSHILEKLGGVIRSKIPNHSIKPTYTGDNITKLELFNGFTQTVINRLVSCDVSYTNDLVTSEVIKIYDTSDGTTVLATTTITYSYTDEELTNIQVSES